MSAPKKTPEPQKGNPSAPDNAHFIERLMDSVNRRACKFVTRIVGDDLNKRFDLVMVTGFAAGAAFALALVGALQ